jgi:ligand-binding SRPBCC domain-containing protein
MAHIHLTTFIKAPSKRVFDLSRSISMHKKSMAHTNETAIAGTTHGLINKGETVTWQAKHFFKIRQFTVAITQMETPLMFEDEMTRGDFKSFIHQHHFKQVDNGTIMIDIVDFESPYGKLGKAVNTLFLKRYMEKLLGKRNQLMKEYAESEKWKAILN